jgi:hypothetical protein
MNEISISSGSSALDLLGLSKHQYKKRFLLSINN